MYVCMYVCVVGGRQGGGVYVMWSMCMYECMYCMGCVQCKLCVCVCVYVYVYVYNVNYVCVCVCVCVCNVCVK